MNRKIIMSLATAKQYSGCNCENPVIVKDRNGNKVACGCGSCASCLKKRRVYWSRRLSDEYYKNPLCLHAFGITLTYDSQNVPYLSAKELKRLKKLKYEQVNKSHDCLVVHRGCSPDSLAKGENVGLCRSRDIELYIKRLRKWLEKNFPALFLRYYIVSDYGEIDYDKPMDKRKRTGRPHYHGVIYVCSKSPLSADQRKNPHWRYVFQMIESQALNAWTFAERFYDPYKKIAVGKDVHKFGERWGDYLGKYINKVVASQYSLGEKYIPTRAFCSRRNDKYGCGSLGVCGWTKQEFDKYYNYLHNCVRKNEYFTIQEKIDGRFARPPKAYINYLFERYFGVRLSRVALAIRWRNLLRLGEVSRPCVAYYPPIVMRSRISIEHNLVKERKIEKCPYFSPIEKYRIGRFLVFLKRQAQLYLDRQGVSNRLCEYDPLLLDFTPADIIDRSLTSTFSQNRQKAVANAKKNLQKALQKKYYHTINNHYNDYVRK